MKDQIIAAPWEPASTPTFRYVGKEAFPRADDHPVDCTRQLANLLERVIALVKFKAPSDRV
jgi:hypothetical protein